MALSIRLQGKQLQLSQGLSDNSNLGPQNNPSRKSNCKNQLSTQLKTPQQHTTWEGAKALAPATKRAARLRERMVNNIV